MRITVLVENTSNHSNFISQHGLSLWVELDSVHLLVDCGPDNTFLRNARTLDIDLQSADAIIMTHNHYDHIGGLEAALQHIPHTPVYIRSTAQRQLYARDPRKCRLLSAPGDLFVQWRDRIHFTDISTSITPQISLHTVQHPDPRWICKDERLVRKVGHNYIPDDFSHEQYVILRDTIGLHIISACSHIGIINIIRHVQHTYPCQAIQSITGGFHMKGSGSLYSLNCTSDYVQQTAHELKAANIPQINTLHCTGTKAFELMKPILGNTLRWAGTGTAIRLD